MALQIQIDPHAQLHVQAFVARWRAPIGQLPPLAQVDSWLSSQLGSCTALPSPDAAVRAAIRDMLRSADFKPTGRAKPSSEYLARTSEGAGLRPINPAVDAGNAVSLHSGIPISVVDCDQLDGRLRIRMGAPDECYVFNATGQVIELAGLVCLYDAQGPCANAIKDAQRTKTSEDTRATLSVLWSSRALVAQTAAALDFYRSLLAGAAELEAVELVA